MISTGTGYMANILAEINTIKSESLLLFMFDSNLVRCDRLGYWSSLQTWSYDLFHLCRVLSHLEHIQRPARFWILREDNLFYKNIQLSFNGTSNTK